MVETHDIDALLISALYGELTPADEARLAAHLESHPTDRSALDDLTRARSLVRDSRFLAFQVDPPQAVSALLLQEAARRATPRRVEGASEEGWFFRFVRSFAAHPAMAAATMLVLVVGVAGVMKMNAHGDFKSAPVETRDQLAAATQPMSATTAAPATPTVGAVPQGAPVAQADPDAPADLAKGELAAAGSATTGYVVNLSDKNADVALDEKKLSPPKTVALHEAPAKKAKGFAVTTPELGLKEDDDSENEPQTIAAKDGKADHAAFESKPRSSYAAANGASGGAATPSTAAAPSPTPPAAPAPVVAKPPAPAAVARDRGAPGGPAGNDQVVDAIETTARADNSLVAWAQKQLGQVVALAKAGKCDDAAKVAQTISAKAPDYYSQNVATNRDLKQCMQYIAAEQDRAEKAAAKAAASKRATSGDSKK